MDPFYHLVLIEKSHKRVTRCCNSYPDITLINLTQAMKTSWSVEKALGSDNLVVTISLLCCIETVCATRISYIFFRKADKDLHDRH